MDQVPFSYILLLIGPEFELSWYQLDIVNVVFGFKSNITQNGIDYVQNRERKNKIVPTNATRSIHHDFHRWLHE